MKKSEGEERLQMQRVMVIGASGVLGHLVCMELLRIYNDQIELIVTDYKIERGKRLASSFNKEVEFRSLNINDEENIKQVVIDVDAVVVTLKQESPLIQKACIDHKILCIDVTPFYDFVAEVSGLSDAAQNNEVGSVVMSGFIPGLSGLMVQKAVSDFTEITEVNIGFLQNTNAKAGISGILDMLRIISLPVSFKNTVIPGFSQKRAMLFLNQNRHTKVRLIEHAEKNLLTEKLKVNMDSIHYWTSWNKNTFNILISLLKRTGMIKVIRKMNRGLLSKMVSHNPSRPEDAFITVEVKGIIDNKERSRLLSLSTTSDYHTTAMATAALVKIAYQKKVVGVVCPFEIASLDEVIAEINSANIIVKEWTPSPST